MFDWLVILQDFATKAACFQYGFVTIFRLIQTGERSSEL